MRLALKTESFAKLFFFLTCLGLIIYAVLAFYTFHTAYFNIPNLEVYEDNIQGFPSPEFKKKQSNDNLKYILIWTLSKESSNIIGEGQQLFYDHQCSCKNCYLTTDKYILNDYTKFDAIIFHAKLLQEWKANNFPKLRSQRQKYIFYGMESSDNAPVCSVFANEYFNWTWSYKLDSDFVSPFIEVKDLEGNVVAPKLSVNWDTNMTFQLDVIREPLKKKKKAMAWIPKLCSPFNKIMRYAKRLQVAFRKKSLDFDIYGCSELDCAKETCLDVIKRDYYFYFAPEYSNVDDYVTDEVLTAYNNNAVPIVTGGADYNKFLPEGSYINAGTTPIDEIVALLEYIIRNPKIYYTFHRWRSHYVISKAAKYEGLCKICEDLNDKNKFGDISVQKTFRKWWNSGPINKMCFPKDSKSISHTISYENISKFIVHRKKGF